MLARIYPITALDPNNPVSTQLALVQAKLQTLAGDDLPMNLDSLAELAKAVLSLQDVDARVVAWLTQISIWQDGEASRISNSAVQIQSILATQFQQLLQAHSVDEEAKIKAIQQQASADATGFQQMYAQLRDLDLNDEKQIVQLFQLVAASNARIDTLAAVPAVQRVRKPLPSLLASALADVVIMLPTAYADTNYTITGLTFEVPNLNLLQVTNIVRAKDRVTISVKNLSLTLGMQAGTIHLAVQRD